MKDYFDNMDVIEENLKYFTTNHEEVYKAYERYGKLVHESGPLDQKICWLIKIALSTASQYPFALRTHILKALKSGCSKEEIEHAIMLVAPTAGFPKTMEGILILRKVMEEVG
ncbi:hypothetical protein SDC9_142185 [bioreactor metagenome]|uniref:Carboxymuconolactone decarboxylase-like domain-containing protein n=1 Tax=bioreactor metagenome TaxID=1076179 RepID=A0A645DZS4_9ZZZZ